MSITFAVAVVVTVAVFGMQSAAAIFDATPTDAQIMQLVSATTCKNQRIDPSGFLTNVLIPPPDNYTWIISLCNPTKQTPSATTPSPTTAPSSTPAPSSTTTPAPTTAPSSTTTPAPTTAPSSTTTPPSTTAPSSTNTSSSPTAPSSTSTSTSSSPTTPSSSPATSSSFSSDSSSTEEPAIMAKIQAMTQSTAEQCNSPYYGAVFTTSGGVNCVRSFDIVESVAPDTGLVGGANSILANITLKQNGTSHRLMIITKCGASGDPTWGSFAGSVNFTTVEVSHKNFCNSRTPSPSSGNGTTAPGSSSSGAGMTSVFVAVLSVAAALAL